MIRYVFITLFSISDQQARLPGDYFFKPARDSWQFQPYETNPYHPEQRSILTNSGIAVRSKSEMIIANALSFHHVPFRYEALLVLGNELRYPDFTIKLPSVEKPVFWEHFGLADRSDYLKSMAAKVHLYMEYDILPWRDLICTYEEDIRDSKRLRRLIEWFFGNNIR